MRDYVLRMDEEQANVISKALELYSRALLGQLGYIAEAIQPLVEERGKAKFREAVEAFDLVAEAVLGFVPGQSHGIHNPRVYSHARIAFDIQQVIRHRLAWAREPQGGMGVNFDDPHPTSRRKALPSFRQIIRTGGHGGDREE